MTEFWRQDKEPGKSKQKRDDDADKNASDFFDRSVRELQGLVKSLIDLSIPCVKVSTTDINAPRLFISPLPSLSIDATHITETLIDLTNGTCSRDKLRVLWVAAQQVNARQKVEVSIRCSGICAHPVLSAKVSRVVLFLFSYSNDALMSLMQSIGGILAKAANLKAKFWSTAFIAFTMTF